MAKSAPKTKKKRGGGPKPVIQITPEMLQQAYELSCLGKTNIQIVTALGFNRHIAFEKGELGDAIKKGRLEALKRVEQTAFDIAITDRNPAMCMFLLKCRMGYREKQEIDLTHSFKPVVIQRKDGTTLELGMAKPEKAEEGGE